LTVRAQVAVALLFLFASACTASTTVTRVVDGRLVQGRYVADEAYAAYLTGAMREAGGDLDGAESAYREAIRHDPRGAEIWTRIGAVRCARLSSANRGASPWEAFRRAEQIDPQMEEAWTARARCHLDLGEIDPALAAVRRAVAADPNRIEPVVLLARILERAGKTEQARLWMDGLVLRDPDSTPAQRAMIEFAARTGDAQRRLAATRALGRAAGVGSAKAAVGDVDDALLRGDTTMARVLGAAAGVTGGALALRAVALGQTAFAREQAEMVASANPSDSDARIAAAGAADLSGDDAALHKAVSGLSASMTQPSPLGRALLLELVERRCGLPASAEEIAATDREGADQLVVRVGARRLRGQRR
jgi:Tfp pilus assembly protein PilF